MDRDVSHDLPHATSEQAFDERVTKRISSSPPIRNLEMIGSRPETPSTTTQIFSTLANSEVTVGGSANWSSVGRDQYNYNYTLNSPDPLEDILRRIESRFAHDCRQQTTLATDKPSSEIIEELCAWALPKLGPNEGREPSVCWLRGSADMGRSTAAALIATKSEDEGTLASSFFFSKDDPDLNHPRHLVHAIAHGLGSLSEDLRQLINDAIRSRSRRLSASLEAQFLHLVARPLLQWKASGGFDLNA
ncbi:hypothetical protein PQX77_017390 [Marasmius sp. AFHP31]|nr:hypothetical protein PQX77_017390 [Marasmius sp. AFHP31]